MGDQGKGGGVNVDLHRLKKSRGNEKDKLLSGVKPRSNDQQTSTPDTEPQSPDKSLSPHSPNIPRPPSRPTLRVVTAVASDFSSLF